MSALYLIRHGQASFGTDDYDRLSATGITQAELLARYWLRIGLEFDAVYAGQMKRQIGTAQEVLSRYREAGRKVPELQILPEFNEYDSKGILKTLVRDTAAADPDLRRDVARFFTDKRAFQRVFAKAVQRWITDGDRLPGLTSWQDFRERVINGIDTVRKENARGKTVLVFTSGGPISAAFQMATRISDGDTLRIVWHIVNTSVSTFAYDAERFSLTSFNARPHLELERNPELITYR